MVRLQGDQVQRSRMAYTRAPRWKGVTYVKPSAFYELCTAP
jgi:hypothetical protein